MLISLTTFSAYLVPSRSSVNCIHFLPLILTNENPVNKIWLLVVELMLLGNQTQTGITCDQGTPDHRLKQAFV